MTFKIFGVFDVKADAFSRPPFFMSTNGQAVRAFADLANDSNTDVGRHPEDYRLMVLGTFDDNKGVVQGQDPTSLGFASEFVKSKE